MAGEVVGTDRGCRPGALWRRLAVLACVLVLAGLVRAQGGGAHGHGETRTTQELSNSEIFGLQFSHLNPHPVWKPEVSHDPEVAKWFWFYNVNLWQVFAVVLMTIVFGATLLSFANGWNNVFVRVFRGWCHWLRDDVVYSLMGEEEGRRFAPFFIYMFFFIAFSNTIGLVPGGVTSTGCIFVTAALALVTFAVMLVGGMLRQGVLGFWKGLLPGGLPLWLAPLMFVVELVSLFVKPFALAVRLFANMLAGHLLIYSFIALVFVFAKMFDLSAISYATAAPTVGMAIFIMIIESLVVLLQAYIFTYLSVLFVQQALHPDH